MISPAQKLADFHALHRSCGSIVDIKPARGESEDGRHALFAWCPACGATSREVVELAALDEWLESTRAPETDEVEFPHAAHKAREWLRSRS